MRYRIESCGNGLHWEVTRLSDGATLVLQGDDALRFGRQLEATNAAYTDDDVCSEYDALFSREGDS